MLVGMQNLPVFVLVAALVACHAASPSQPVADAAAPAPPASSAPTPAPAPTPEPHDACWSAGQKLISLACKDTRGRLMGGPDLQGVSWSVVCRQDLANGVDLKASCIAGAASCTAAEACK
jgi:hypothetical protein